MGVRPARYGVEDLVPLFASKRVVVDVNQIAPALAFHHLRRINVCNYRLRLPGTATYVLVGTARLTTPENCSRTEVMADQASLVSTANA